ncbi:putative galactinol--sucrose galactosyltransferase 6 [Gracilariopsis chorda]|uniref:galactinol--sucrose galactosyltransferase n=1 Tax=Gracilariopsis chorda TaxID=448386 RepID=A0A2V3IWV8_9FLOR|nr:putative galactinol--sucrose galactosyltransferase 6 [Gracilariopsis chorda]|eukprot:PXF46636.1 putative galactinol--sucrose galactosyltransferase 6 [Gracilariopsis chorda]
MQFHSHWNREELRCSVLSDNELKKLVLQPPQQRDNLFTLIESFCLPECYITVSLDAIPVRSASVTLSTPTSWKACPTDKHVQPIRIHYGYATSSSTWNDVQDAYFDVSSTNCYVAHINLTQNGITGLSFVLQLANGEWLKDYNGADFYVGNGHRNTPACVEVPLSSPWNPATVQLHRITSLYKQNPFWMAPDMPEARSLDSHSPNFDLLCDVQHETVFVLNELRKTHQHPQQDLSSRAGHLKARSLVEYVAILFLADAKRGLRTTLFSTGTYPAIRIESGRCESLRIDDISRAHTCYMLASPDVHTVTGDLIEEVSHRLRTFSSRRAKMRSPEWTCLMSRHQPILKSLGFCTWDAFGHNVSEAKVMDTMEWFRSRGVRFGYLILDDGWQGGGDAGPNFEHSPEAKRFTDRPCLVSYGPNRKFSGSVSVLRDEASTSVMVWTAAIGYWGGTSGSACNLQTRIVKGTISKGLRHNNIGDTKHWEKLCEVPVPTEENLSHFFNSYFGKSLSSVHKVAGLKIDAQSILETLHNGVYEDDKKTMDTRQCSLTSSYRSAITKAVSSAFPESIIVNSMACGQEVLFASGVNLSPANVCWRTSDDHAFPDLEESEGMVVWHILRNALNTILLGEIFPITDWDMFAVNDRFAKLHAVARVLSGGPLCISDRTPWNGNEGLAFLRSLITSDGTILRCSDPGQPTVDCIFEDPRRAPRKLFKVFNRSAVNGIIGIFNLHDSAVGSNMGGSFAPRDIHCFSRTPGNVSYISWICYIQRNTVSAFHHCSNDEQCFLEVLPLDAVLIHISPVIHIPLVGGLAALGKPGLLNAGAAIAAITISKKTSIEKPEHGKLNLSEPSQFISAEVVLHDSGEMLFWLDGLAAKSLLYVLHDCKHIEDVTYRIVSDIKFLLVTIPSREPRAIEFLFDST